MLKELTTQTPETSGVKTKGTLVGKEASQFATQPKVVFLLNGGMEYMEGHMDLAEDRLKLETVLAGNPQVRFRRPMWSPTRLVTLDPKGGRIMGRLRARAVVEEWKRGGADVIVTVGKGSEANKRQYPIPDDEIPIEADVYKDFIDHAVDVDIAVARKRKRESIPSDTRALNQLPPYVLPERESPTTLKSAENIVAMMLDLGLEEATVVSSATHLIRAPLLIDMMYQQATGRQNTGQIKYVTAEDILLKTDRKKYGYIIDEFLNPEKNEIVLFTRETEEKGKRDFLEGKYSTTEIGIDKLSLEIARTAFLKAINSIPQTPTINAYEKAVSALDVNGDQMGTIQFLLEVGKLLAPFFGMYITNSESIKNLMNAWDFLKDALEPEDAVAAANLESLVKFSKTACALVSIEQRSIKKRRVKNESAYRKKRMDAAKRRIAIREYIKRNNLKNINGKELAELFGIGKLAMYQDLAELRLSSVLESKATERRERMKAMDAAGEKMTVVNLAIMFGVSKAQISKDLTQIGLRRYRLSQKVLQNRASILSLYNPDGKSEPARIAYLLNIPESTIKFHITAMVAEGILDTNKKAENGKDEKLNNETDTNSQSSFGIVFTKLQEKPDISLSELQEIIKQVGPSDLNPLARLRMLCYLNYDKKYQIITNAAQFNDSIPTVKQIDTALIWLQDNNLIKRGSRGVKPSDQVEQRLAYMEQELRANPNIPFSEFQREFGIRSVRNIYRYYHTLLDRGLQINRDTRDVQPTPVSQEGYTKREERKALIKALWFMGINDTKMNELAQCKASRVVDELSDEKTLTGRKPTSNMVRTILQDREEGIPLDDIVVNNTEFTRVTEKTVRTILLLPDIKVIDKDPKQAAVILNLRLYLLENQFAPVQELMESFNVSKYVVDKSIRFLRGFGLLPNRKSSSHKQ